MKRDVTVFFLWLVLLCFGPTNSTGYAGPELPAQNPYILTSWTIADGLPQQSVLCLLQRRDGYIWFGTQAGLVRFDGSNCRVFNRWNTPNLKNDRILSLFEDSQGALWIGTDGGGLVRYQDELWFTFTTQQGLSHDTVHTITQDRQGQLWIGTDTGLTCFQNGRPTPFPQPQDLASTVITTLAVDPHNTLWIGTGSNGLYSFKDRKFQHNFPNPAAITALLVDHTGTLWLGTEKGLFFLQHDHIQPAPPGTRSDHPLNQASIKAIIQEPAGSIWIATEGEGLFRYPFLPLLPPGGLPDDFIYSLLHDREGNLWIGTYTAGLLQLKPRLGHTLTKANGLPENTLQTVLALPDGNLWIGTERTGVIKYDLKKQAVVQTLTRANGLTGNRVNALWRDNDQTIYIGTTTGLNRLIGEKIQTYTTREGLSHENITAIIRDKRGTLWIGTQSGLNCSADQGLSFALYPGSPILQKAHIRTLLENRQGLLWIGTRGGLFLLRPNSTLHPIASVTEDILAIYQDQNGTLWLGTNGSGLLQLKNNGASHPISFTTAQGVPDNYIFSITSDIRHHLWLTSYRGLFRLPHVAQSVAPPQTDNNTIIAILFDEKDGLGSGQCAMTGQPAAALLPHGPLVVPTSQGLAILDPQSPAVHLPAPPVLLEDVIVDNISLANPDKQKGDFSLPSGNHILEFYFTALSFASPSKVRLRYKLAGFDKQWKEVPPYRRRTALYLNLPAGKYTFTLSACGTNGIWSSQNPRFMFRIRPPFYREPYFLLILLLLVVALGIGAIFLWRRKRLVSEKPTIPQVPVPTESQADGGDEIAAGKEKYKTSALLQETVDSVLPELTRLMEKEKMFLDPRLNLKILSNHLNIHYNHLSRIINEQLGKSFNDYINYYRIQEAKKRLADSRPAEMNKTVLEVAYDTGFYSKSVFNSAFKKFTHMTPSQYKREQHPHLAKNITSAGKTTDQEQGEE